MRFLILALLVIAHPALAGWQLVNYREIARFPGGGIAWEREAVDGAAAARITGFTFPAKAFVFHVVDNPPPHTQRLATTMPASGAVAGINGSYFHPDYTPLGLVISAGKTLHRFEKAKLLSGILAVRGGRIELVRADSFKTDPTITEAIQAGPWLVENSDAIRGLNDVRRARRSIVATDGRGTWSIMAISPVTLAQCATLLTSEVFKAAPWKDALNLDGGSSTALWASGQAATAAIPEFGPVRNYLAIMPRSR